MITDEMIMGLIERITVLTAKVELYLQKSEKHEQTLYGSTGDAGLVAAVRDLQQFRNDIQKKVDRILYPLALAGIFFIAAVLWNLLLHNPTW